MAQEPEEAEGDEKKGDEEDDGAGQENASAGQKERGR